MQTRTIISPTSLSDGYSAHAAAECMGRSRAGCSASFTGGRLKLRELVVIWLFGLLGISAGFLLWQMDAEGLWLVRGVSFSAALGGLFLWGVLLHSLWMEGRRHPVPSAAQNGFWFYSGGATHLEPVVEVLGQYSRLADAHAALLLRAEGGVWTFKAGYQCSPGLGRAVAHALHHRVSRGCQTVCLIEVLDAAMVAFCTPLTTTEGRDFLLVSLSQSGEQACHGAVAAAALRCAIRIGRELDGVEALRRRGPANGVQAQGGKAPVCCSVCDRLQIADQGQEQELWVPWNEWLFQNQGTHLTHGICPHCLSWAYPEAASSTTPVRSPFLPRGEVSSATALRGAAV